MLCLTQLHGWELTQYQGIHLPGLQFLYAEQQHVSQSVNAVRS